eukprot:1610070-Pyramimonas_sp.AAC.1
MTISITPVMKNPPMQTRSLVSKAPPSAAKRPMRSPPPSGEALLAFTTLRTDCLSTSALPP